MNLVFVLFVYMYCTIDKLRLENFSFCSVKLKDDIFSYISLMMSAMPIMGNTKYTIPFLSFFLFVSWPRDNPWNSKHYICINRYNVEFSVS